MTDIGTGSALLRSADRFFIGGEWVAPATDARIDVIEPSTEERFYSVAEASATDMSRAVAAARAAFDTGPWPRMTPQERAAVMRDLANRLSTRTDDLARIWTSEMGIVNMYAKFIVGTAADVYSYYAGLADDFPFIERHHTTAGGDVGLLVREPVGVVGAIVPWNSAAHLLAYKAAPALLAGCTLVLKSSPEAPGSAYVLAEVAEEIGLPPGVINVVTADREVSELLVRDPRVDKITFTGSTAAGRRIASICGERIARYTLELGGKSAAVVLDDADIGAVASSLAGTACFMTGQVCASLTRIIVPAHKQDAFVDALSATFAHIAVGDPYEPTTGMGPLAARRHLERVEDYIAVGQHEGAKLAIGGHRPAHLDRGFYIEPTVFADVDNESRIAQEEIFGPVLSVIPARDDDHAIELANSTIYGLNASVFTPDTERAFAVARRLRSGTVGHNAQRVEFGIAFGGVKQSGVGREGGREGVYPYLESKTVVLEGELAAAADLPMMPA
ncbi:MAG TPA: aldehyde dehydrogenase [Ilumatobacteraceae bacterium]|jgi:betaine-aldehyde dehydrogenase